MVSSLPSPERKQLARSDLTYAHLTQLSPPTKNSDILVEPLNTPPVERLDIDADEGSTKMSGFIVTLQQKILALLNFPVDIYTQLGPIGRLSKILVSCIWQYSYLSLSMVIL